MQRDKAAGCRVAHWEARRRALSIARIRGHSSAPPTAHLIALVVARSPRLISSTAGVAWRGVAWHSSFRTPEECRACNLECSAVLIESSKVGP